MPNLFRHPTCKVCSMRGVQRVGYLSCGILKQGQDDKKNTCHAEFISASHMQSVQYAWCTACGLPVLWDPETSSGRQLIILNAF